VRMGDGSNWLVRGRKMVETGLGWCRSPGFGEPCFRLRDRFSCVV
jgi:hypothetical protein